MSYYVILYYVVLYCIGLCYVVSCCVMSYCDVLCYNMLCCIVWRCVVVWCIMLGCVVLCYVVLCCALLWCGIGWCVVLYCIMLCCIVLCCGVMWCSVLYYIDILHRFAVLDEGRPANLYSGVITNRTATWSQAPGQEDLRCKGGPTGQDRAITLLRKQSLFQVAIPTQGAGGIINMYVVCFLFSISW